MKKRISISGWLMLLALVSGSLTNTLAGWYRVSFRFDMAGLNGANGPIASATVLTNGVALPDSSGGGYQALSGGDPSSGNQTGSFIVPGEIVHLATGTCLQVEFNDSGLDGTAFPSGGFISIEQILTP